MCVRHFRPATLICRKRSLDEIDRLTYSDTSHLPTIVSIKDHAYDTAVCHAETFRVMHHGTVFSAVSIDTGDVVNNSAGRSEHLRVLEPCQVSVYGRAGRLVMISADMSEQVCRRRAWQIYHIMT